MKSVGIIGGVGATTTSVFYEKIVYDCQNINHEHRPLVVITSVPTPYKVENETILNNNVSGFRELLINEAKRLEKTGVDYVCMPCNTLHHFAKDIKNAISLPFVSIVDTTMDYINKNGYKKVGMISTGSTVINKVYENRFIEDGIDFVCPNSTDQQEMNNIITRIISNKLLDTDREFLEKVIVKHKQNGADCIALACTDLQMLKPKGDIPIFDTMSELANKIVDLIK
ncbi:aspartate racemase [Bacilli bacterium]|nr:aspartate racemase [Bacilli bacterium]GHU53483.1 aspartate racemase [Bacilli bacterium]